MNKTIHILIIDDDNVDIQLISRAIQSSGYTAEIRAANDVTSGEEMIRQARPDCILLDYGLPGINGLRWLQHLHEAHGPIPVVVVTGRGDENVAVQAMKLGAVDYLSKSRIQPVKLKEVLQHALANGKPSPAGTAARTDLDAASLADHSPVTQFLVDATGIIRLCKGKWVERLSLSAGEIVNRSVFDLCRELPVDARDIRNALKGTESTGELERDSRFFTVHYVPHRTEHGIVNAVSCFAIDCTQSKESEAALKGALDEARELRKIKETFLANMSHEIRTPIHGILNLSDILLKTDLNGEQRKFLDAIRKSADTLLVIINDILDISKIEANKMTIEQAPFCLREVLNTTYDLLEPRAAEKNIAFDMHLGDDLPETVLGDSVRYTQIVTNLVINAIKFTEKGSVRLDVMLEEANENFCVVTTRVTDTGIGIARHKQHSIFDSFTQASDDITRKYGGTGLGLSICQRLVEMQGGMMTVESELAKGSVFTFRLPFEKHKSHTRRVAAPAMTKQPQGENLRLLVVEDNEINRMVVQKIIRDWGYALDLAADGREAVALVEKNTYDVILMDIEMPGLNGYDTTRLIRGSSQGHGNVPILAMTAHASGEEQEKCLRAGMDDYISKPFDAGELQEKLLQLHRRRKVPEAGRITDLKNLRAMSDGNDEFIRNFITLFLENTPPALEELRKACAAADWESVRFTAHKLKPSLSYVGMKEMHQTALWLETSARKRENLGRIPETAERLVAACGQACRELESELNSLPI